MLRASVMVLSLACLLSWSETARAEEAGQPLQAGELVWTNQLASGMWKIYVRAKDATPDRRVTLKVKTFTERGITLVQVEKDQTSKRRYETLIPWHAVSAIVRETDEPADAPE